MTIDEAIYCMKSYMPDNKKDICLSCPYYGSIHVEDKIYKHVYTCKASEAHKMAIEALEKMKANNHGLRLCRYSCQYGGEWVDGYFHRWIETSDADVHGHRAKAIVENARNGSLEIVNWSSIQFTDQ